MNWNEYKKEFEWDGSWRDLYILKSDISDWQRLIDLFQADKYKIVFKVGDQISPIPKEATEIFQRRNEASVLMSIDMDGVIINCHFFTEEEIEFDIDPREVNSEENLSQLLKFMQRIGGLLQKEVILTPENIQNVVIFRYVPRSGKVEYTPFGGWQ